MMIDLPVRQRNQWLLLAATLTLLSCDGSDGNSSGKTSGSGVAPATAAIPTLTFAPVKTFRFDWTDVGDATHYRLLENPDGVSGFTQVGSDIAQGTQTVDHVVPLYARVNAQYILQSCNAAGCADSANVPVSGTLVGSIGYFKASNNGADDEFGRAVSLSADGNTLAVGAFGEDSNAIGINGDQTNNSASGSGAVYVFSRNGSSWSQQAYIKASNTETFDGFGNAVSLSADGNTLAVGASGEASNGTGINGDQTDNSASGSGAVYVFGRSGGNWSQEAYVKASNPEFIDSFGNAVSLSADGNTLAVGAEGEDSSATGINGNESDNSALDSGAVYVFSRSGSNWSQEAYIKASNPELADMFGTDVSLSASGNTLAVGASGEASNATGINGDETDNSALRSGAVYLFEHSGGSWSQQAYVKASNPELDDVFGTAVDLSADGNTLAVGASGEASNTTGINGDETNNSAKFSGAAYVFSRSGSNWSQEAYVKSSNAEENDRFGGAVSLSADGNSLTAGADEDDSNAIGINGDETDNSVFNSGAVYVFSRDGSPWAQQAYVKASNPGEFDAFGRAVSLSADGNTLAVGAVGEDSNATGINGDQSDDSSLRAGAVYLY